MVIKILCPAVFLVKTQEKFQAGVTVNFYIKIYGFTTSGKVDIIYLGDTLKIKATSNKTVQIPLGQTYTNRYVRMAGFKRGTSYGYSFYEMGVWLNSTESYDV